MSANMGRSQRSLVDELWLASKKTLDQRWFGEAIAGALEGELTHQAFLAHDIIGNPFRPVTFLPEWLTSTVVALAQQMYDSRDFSALPILADAMQDAGCENTQILEHCRGPGPHVRGCWVVDLCLNKC
jgi:hypothetical protein